MKLKDIGVTPLIEMSAGGTTSAGGIASVMAPLGKAIIRRKKKKDKNPSIYGGSSEENVLFAEGSARPEYHNTQVKGSDATPKAKPGRTKHPFKGKLVGEGDMEADREAGIKWVDNPEWEQLHNMNLDMIKDFLNHKENVPEAVGDSAKPLYDLQDELGLEDNILVDELARYLDVDQIADFVSQFRRHHNENYSNNDEDTQIERKLSGEEKKNKEHNVKKLKKHKGDFSKYGKDAESVMYAVATKSAKKGKKYK